MNEPKPEYRVDEFGQHVKLRRRPWRQWLRDVWAAATGKTFCTVRVCQGEKTWYVDCRQDYLFPIVSRRSSNNGAGISLDLLYWNGAGFFPLAKRPHPPAYEAEYESIFPPGFRDEAEKARGTWASE